MNGKLIFMKFKDLTSEELDALEQVRKVFVIHGYALARYEIPRAGTINLSESQIKKAVDYLVALNILFKSPLNGGSDSNTFDLTEVGRSKLSLAEMREREEQEAKAEQHKQADQEKTNLTNRRYTRLSFVLAFIALIVSIIAIALDIILGKQ